jgi:hypothetical protein
LAEQRFTSDVLLDNPGIRAHNLRLLSSFAFFGRQFSESLSNVL